MRILILVDLLNNWALHNRAKAIKKYINNAEVEIRGVENHVEIRKALFDITALEGHEKFDVIHFNFTYGVTLFHDFIIKNKDRCVITIVNERSLLEGFGVDKGLLEKIMKECPHITTVSRTISEKFKVRYIPNGIDKDLFFKCKNPVVGYAGTEKENKNVFEIIKACRELGLRFETAFYREGNPEYSHDKMQDFYMKLDVYIHASLTEGFNNTVIEALSCNVPVLMTKQGSWQEFEGWVEFIEPTCKDIKRGLQKILGRSLIEEKFTWEKIVSQYLEVYKSAVH